MLRSPSVLQRLLLFHCHGIHKALETEWRHCCVRGMLYFWLLYFCLSSLKSLSRDVVLDIFFRVHFFIFSDLIWNVFTLTFSESLGKHLKNAMPRVYVSSSLLDSPTRQGGSLVSWGVRPSLVLVSEITGSSVVGRGLRPKAPLNRLVSEFFSYNILKPFI